MYIALEFGILYKLSGLVYYRLVAARLYYPALMEGKRTEAAPSEASPVAYQAELYLFYGVYAARILIAGMIGAHIWQCVDAVHFLLSERL